MKRVVERCGVWALMSAALVLASCSPEAPPQSAEIAPSTTLPEPDALFPRTLSSPAGAVVVHAPQIDEWNDYRLAKARVALEVTLTGEPTTLIGTGFVTAATETDFESRTVTLHKINAERFVFTGVEPASEEKASALVRDLMNKDPQKVPLDLFLGYVQGDEAKASAAALNMAPPPIFVSYTPAILVIVNGKPVMAPIKESALTFAFNTNWDLFQLKETWYLRNEEQWLSAADPKAKWSVVKQLPGEFARLPADDNWRDARAKMPPSSTRAAPTVFYSETPAEMIVIEGKPVLAGVGELGLMYITNTQSDVFISGGTYYYLASGRWFTTSDLEGEWRAAGLLPDAFASIPSDHAKAHVRVSVAGTDEAKRAVQEASIPRTAVLATTTTPSITVTYNGQPTFVPITGTTLTRASNSMYDVISDGSSYYLCYDAVWYVASTPTGPWKIATVVPPAIYSIPPSSSAHHVTYVKVYETTPTTVTTGYTGGYYGAYSTGVTIVFGTGYMYPPYVGYGAFYPVYYWHPYSYGYGSWYNPTSGAFGSAQVAYGPYGGAGRTAAYNPSTGTYRRGYAAWDSDEIAGTARAYNPRTGTGAATRGYATDDYAWKQTAIARGDEWVYSERERDGDTSRTEFVTSRGGEGDITSTRNGDSVSRDATFEKNDRSITTSGQRTDGGYSGSFQTSGGASGTVNRSLEDGELSRNAQVNRDGKTTDISGSTTRTAQGLQTDFTTSGGVSGSTSRQVQDGYVQREGEFSRGDQSFSTDFVRGSEGTAGRIETGSGESMGMARTESGDLYAAKDGEIYRKSDSGWEQHDSGSWKQSQSAGASSYESRASELDRERETRSRSFEQYGQHRQNRQPRRSGRRR